MRDAFRPEKWMGLGDSHREREEEIVSSGSHALACSCRAFLSLAVKPRRQDLRGRGLGRTDDSARASTREFCGAKHSGTSPALILSFQSLIPRQARVPSPEPRVEIHSPAMPKWLSILMAVVLAIACGA